MLVISINRALILKCLALIFLVSSCQVDPVTAPVDNNPLSNPQSSSTLTQTDMETESKTNTNTQNETVGQTDTHTQSNEQTNTMTQTSTDSQTSTESNTNTQSQTQTFVDNNTAPMAEPRMVGTILLAGASDNEGDVLTYLWEVNGNNVGTGTFVNIADITNVTGTQTVTLTVTDSGNLSVVKNVQVDFGQPTQTQTQTQTQTDTQTQVDTDQDNDGVEDDVDNCPNTIGVVVSNGCSQAQLDALTPPPADDDMDGVANDADNCPNTIGAVVSNGCSQAQLDALTPPPADDDMDGVANDADNCPNTIGAVVSNGCSQAQLDALAPPAIDDDMDGVANDDDWCDFTEMDAPVDANGCSDLQLGESFYFNLDCANCHGDTGLGGEAKQVRTCSKVDCTNLSALTIYNKNSMPRRAPGDCVSDDRCDELVSKYMIDKIVTFTNDDDKDGVNNNNDQCDNTRSFNRDKVEANGCMDIPVNSENTSMYINAGGNSFVSNLNESFIADDYFNNGSIYTSTLAIDNTVDDALFQTERFGNFDYEIPMKNGDYEIALYFAETYFTEAGKRVFDLSIEGNKKLTNFDVFADANAINKAVYKKFDITINDGFLSISVDAVTNNPKINAIKIYEKGATPPPVVIPENNFPLQSVGIGPYGGCVIQPNGETVCWGGNYMNQKFTENGTQKNCFDNPTQWGIGECVGRAVAPNNLGEVISVAGMHTSACAILKNPTATNKAIRCWGPETNPVYPDIHNPIQLSHGDRQSCALTSTGEVKCWEININKEGYTNHVAPDGLIASVVSSGGRMTCAITKSDSSVVCFGDVTKAPPAGLKAKRVEVGGWAGDTSPVHACAIDLNDNVICWGDGAGVNVPSGLKAQSITSAEKWSCAVKLDGTAQCWGNFSNAPSGSDFKEVFAQRDAGVLIKTDGTVVQFKDYGTNKRIDMPVNLKVRLDN